MILYCPFIKFLVIVYGSKTSILLFDEEKWCSVWTGRWFDIFFGKLIIDAFVHGFHLLLG